MSKADPDPHITPVEPAVAAAPAAGPFDTLRNANFRLLISGTVASGFANWMEAIGQGWLVHELTNSPFQLGFVQFLRGISILFISPFAGAIAERIDRRWLAGVATGVNAINALAVGLLVATGRVEMWHLYVTSFIGGSASSVYNPVRQYLVYSAVGPESLTGAIAINAGAMNMSRVVAPNVSGALIGFAGVESSFFAESMFFGAACMTLLQLRLREVEVRTVEPMLRSVRLGISFLARDAVLRRIVLLQAVPTLLVYPYLQLMPSMSADYLHVGAQGFGLLQTGVGVGSISMTFVVARFATIGRKGPIMSLALIAYIAMIFAFSFSRIYVLSFALLVLGGMNLVVFSTFNQSLLQLHVDDEYRGRVLALFTMVQGLNPFGSLFMGALAERTSTPTAIGMFCAVAIVAAFLAGAGNRQVREL